MAKVIEISAIWDAEASVWVAESKHVPGLITEAPTMEALVESLKVLIPELLDANGYQDGEELPFTVHSEVSAVTHRHHC